MHENKLTTRCVCLFSAVFFSLRIEEKYLFHKHKKLCLHFANKKQRKNLIINSHKMNQYVSRLHNWLSLFFYIPRAAEQERFAFVCAGKQGKIAILKYNKIPHDLRLALSEMRDYMLKSTSFSRSLSPSACTGRLCAENYCENINSP